MPDYQLLTELLGLPHVRVSHYRLQGADTIELTVASTLPAAVCPDCQQVSSLVHDSGAPQRLRDLPIWGRRCWLAYAPRRFDCVPCGRTFVERVAWREPGRDYTQRYSEHVYQRARREPLAQIAQSEQLSEDSVHGLFEREAKKHSPRAAIPS
jgi:transposase